MLKNLWERISNIGIDPELTFSERSRVRIANQIAVILSLAIWGYYLYSFVAVNEQRTPDQWMAYNVLALVGGLQFIPVLIFNHKKFYSTGRFLSFAIFTPLLLYNAVKIAEPYRSEIYFFAAAAFVFVIFREMKFIIPVYLFLVVAYYFSAFTVGQLHPEVVAVNSSLAIRIMLAFTFLFLILLFLRKETTLYQDQLEERNAELSAERDEIEKINFTKDKIFSIISHDLRSPINSFQGLLGLLQQKRLSEDEFKTATATLEKQVSQLKTTLDELLAWSKAQLHGINPEPQQILLRPLVGEMVALNRIAARNKTIIITTNIKTEATAYCDPNMLKSALTNLISNAIKFTPTGGAITITSLQDHDKTKIIIEGTGLGITEENLAKILNPTIHFTTRGTSNEKGTGLGLKMSKEFIEKNRGTFEIESEDGKGSRFTITLPL
jgi:two-component system, sensor histidine kinase and response regulator